MNKRARCHYDKDNRRTSIIAAHGYVPITTATGRQSLQRRDIIIIIIRISGRCVLTETDQGVKLIILWFRKNIFSGIIFERKRVESPYIINYIRKSIIVNVIIKRIFIRPRRHKYVIILRRPAEVFAESLTTTDFHRRFVHCLTLKQNTMDG